MNTHKSKKGFTLAELLVVIAIIAVLAAIGIPSILAAQRETRNAQRQSQLKAVSDMAASFYAEYGSDFDVYTSTTGANCSSAVGTTTTAPALTASTTYYVCASSTPTTSRSRQLTFTDGFYLERSSSASCPDFADLDGAPKKVLFAIDTTAGKIVMCNEGGSGVRSLSYK